MQRLAARNHRSFHPSGSNQAAKMNPLTLASAALLAGVVSLGTVSPVNAFVPHNILAQHALKHGSSTTGTSTTSTTSLSAKRKKLSMAEKRKRRGRKLPPRQVERPAVLDRTAPVDQWAPTKTTDESVAQMKVHEDAATAEEAAIQARATELIESQRKSVDTLTHIKERVQAMPYESIGQELQAKGYYVFDKFLDQEELVMDMEAEALAMMEADKLERDVSNLESGEFAVRIAGGEEQYADLPRTVEYIVSSTRHMPPLLEEMEGLGSSLDDAASTATLRVFDRKARESSLALLSEAPPPREYALVNEDPASDPKKVTVLYFLSDWGDEGAGGGVGFDDGSMVSPARDRLVIFRSDTCKYRMEPVAAGGSSSNFAYIVNQLLRKSADENQS